MKKCEDCPNSFKCCKCVAYERCTLQHKNPRGDVCRSAREEHVKVK